MSPETRARYLELIAECDALPDDEDAQALREGLLKSLEPPAPPDPIAERTNELLAVYFWALVDKDEEAIRVAVKNMRQWLMAVFAGDLNTSDESN
jgi:cyanate lyase